MGGDSNIVAVDAVTPVSQLAPMFTSKPQEQSARGRSGIEAITVQEITSVRIKMGHFGDRLAGVCSQAGWGFSANGQLAAANFSQPLASSANTLDKRPYTPCLTSAAIRSPHSRSVTARSYRDCRFIQNCELLPKKYASRSAVSGLIDRLPLRMPVIRPDGTCSARASLLADSPRAANSRFRIRPG